jgi:hypothetical protein
MSSNPKSGQPGSPFPSFLWEIESARISLYKLLPAAASIRGLQIEPGTEQPHLQIWQKLPLQIGLLGHCITRLEVNRKLGLLEVIRPERHPTPSGQEVGGKENDLESKPEPLQLPYRR